MKRKKLKVELGSNVDRNMSGCTIEIKLGDNVVCSNFFETIFLVEDAKMLDGFFCKPFSLHLDELSFFLLLKVLCKKEKHNTMTYASCNVRFIQINWVTNR